MRAALLAASIVLAAALACPAHGDQDLPFDIKALPLDDASLKTLDGAQLRLTRKASTICHHNTSPAGGSFMSGSAPPAMIGCIISTLDQLVAGENNPALSAYHHVMTPSRRYNENRDMSYWRTVQKQRQAGSPIPGVGKLP